MSIRERETIMIAGIERLGIPLSAAVIVGDLIFVSGQVAYDPETGELRPGTFAEEAELAFANLQRVLQAAGSRLEDVIKVTAYLADIRANFSLYNELYRRWFVPPYPARTTIGADLGGLQIELEAIARRSATRLERESRARKEVR
ncbi:Putative reactive intermediate deaminase TdcF [bacterium HR08]|nr:Putative reactive intermediate deaminase TdcF [bacterium HR08]